MDGLLEILGRFTTLLRSTGVVLGAVIAMGVLNRLLQRGDGPASGRRFRNQLVLFGASIVVVLLVILALPLGDEMRGQLLGLFGIVISATIALSSSTFLGNAMAGIMLKTVRNFRSGDFISVGEHFGRVSERGLFHTEIQTPERDLTTLPNLYLATTPVRVIRSSGTIVSASLSLGYDVHHSRIEELLLQAVADAGLSEPFVQMTELGDFSVTYRAAGLLTEVKSLLAVRSRLRSAMVDALHGGGVEIVSPSFRNVRTYEGDRTFVPQAPRRPTEPSPDAAPVDVVFDKAETAETHESLRQQRERLDAELKEALQAAKDTADQDAAGRAARRAEILQARMARLEAAIAETKEDEDEGPL